MHRNAPSHARRSTSAVSADRGRLDGRACGGVDEHLAPSRAQVVASLSGRGRGGARGPLESSATCPHQTPPRVERRIVASAPAPQARSGPSRGHRGGAGVDGASGAGPSRREPARSLDRATRAADPPDRDDPSRRARPHRLKKLGRIPDGGGWRVHGRAAGRERHGTRRPRSATPTSTPRSTPTPGSPTASSPATRRRHRGRVLDSSRRVLRRRTASPSNGSSPTTATATAAATSTAALGAHLPHPHPALPARHQRQGRTVQPHPARRMGLRPALDSEANAPAPLTAGSTATTITATTPPSAAHPSAASPTWRAQQLTRMPLWQSWKRWLVSEGKLPNAVDSYRLVGAVVLRVVRRPRPADRPDTMQTRDDFAEFMIHLLSPTRSTGTAGSRFRGLRRWFRVAW